MPGRMGADLEIIAPSAPEQSHPRSLSVSNGLGRLPLHVELSHRTVPCRYVAMACLDPGHPRAATLLLDRKTLGFTPEDEALLVSAPIFVRSGRRSFYSTLMPPHRSYLRYDPGCIEAPDERGLAALEFLEKRLSTAEPQKHEWQPGDILVIDNWRVLHGRSSSAPESGRRLARIMIDA